MTTAPLAESAAAAKPLNPWVKRVLYLVHAAIIVNFLVEIVYCGYIVFTVLKPEGISGPLFDAAATLPFELVSRRRMYATEMWIATGGLAVYLALTEIGPRIKRYRGF